MTQLMTEKIAALNYQPYYCEENIWQLCQNPQYAGGQVLFISAYGEHFAMLCQQGGEGEEHLVCWDYHVIFLHEGNILDFNSTLTFPTPSEQYFNESFIDENLLPEALIPVFRVMRASEYAESFLSDRRHMRTKHGWSAPPPDWPLISKSRSNLAQFADMRDPEFGEVLSLSEVLFVDGRIM